MGRPKPKKVYKSNVHHGGFNPLLHVERSRRAPDTLETQLIKSPFRDFAGERLLREGRVFGLKKRRINRVKLAQGKELIGAGVMLDPKTGQSIGEKWVDRRWKIRKYKTPQKNKSK
ncbi:MAG: hypothetical protein HY392_02465 [Candidatus Diapherotrites archaeon]|nr:hypothetical protein [Candidatus Diapherotrites archaeon]